VAANPQTKPVDLGFESAENWLIQSTSTIASIFITQPVGWYSSNRPCEGDASKTSTQNDSPRGSIKPGANLTLAIALFSNSTHLRLVDLSFETS